MKKEENISYRKIRSIKSTSISHTSQRLLQPIFRFRNTKNVDKDLMTQNVSQYQYMIKDSCVKENCISWITNLRQQMKLENKEGKDTQSSPPSVFYKPTESFCLRTKDQNKNSKVCVNTGEFSQFFGKNTSNILENQNQMIFVSQLRRSDAHDNQINKQNEIHSKQFNLYAHREGTSLPRILNKNAIKKTKSIQLSDYDLALDGSQNYPSYSYNILKQKNSSLYKDLAKPNETQSLPGLAWSIGLRNY